MTKGELVTFCYSQSSMSLFRHRLLDLAFWAAVFVIAAKDSVSVTTASSAFLATRSPSPRLIEATKHSSSTSRTTRVICRAIKVTIRIVGRRSGGEEWLEQGCSMYEKRLGPNNIEMTTIWHKTNDALCKAAWNENKVVVSSMAGGAVVVLLDPEFGKSCTSNQFAEQFYQWVQDGGSRLVFVIGGAEGLPNELRFPSSSNNSNNNNKKKPIFLSLSDLTFTHQFARLLLTEQIYRASEIRKGSGYHK